MSAQSATGHAVTTSALSNSSQAANDQRKAKVADRSSTCRILVADDDPHARRMVARSLRRHGFEVVEDLL